MSYRIIIFSPIIVVNVTPWGRFLASIFSTLSCFLPFSLVPHTTILSETRSAYPNVFFPLVFFLIWLTIFLGKVGRWFPVAFLPVFYGDTISRVGLFHHPSFFFLIQGCGVLFYSILFTYLYTAPLAVKTNQRRPPARLAPGKRKDLRRREVEDNVVVVINNNNSHLW